MYRAPGTILAGARKSHLKKACSEPLSGSKRTERRLNNLIGRGVLPWHRVPVQVTNLLTNDGIASVASLPRNDRMKMMTELVKHEPTTIYIKPPSGFTALNLRDLWVYRELVFFMVWRDIKVRYKQTLLGA